MANVVRAAIVQTEWTGDKQSMIDRNVEYARKAAEQGAQAGVRGQQGPVADGPDPGRRQVEGPFNLAYCGAGDRPKVYFVGMRGTLETTRPVDDTLDGIEGLHVVDPCAEDRGALVPRPDRQHRDGRVPVDLLE